MIPEKDLIRFFGRCQNPRVIINRYTGKPVLVSCGRCSNCLNHKCDRNSLLCEIQSQQYKYTYFVTLTYSNLHLPCFKLVGSSSNFIVQGNSRSTYNAICVTPRLRKIFNAKLFSVDATDEYIASLSRKVNLCGKFGFSYLPDLQNFIKRVRSYFEYHFNLTNEISYFAVSEYGPIHFRPHYHLLFFSNSDIFSENIYEIVSKCWKYGRVDCQLADAKCGSYLSSYVNSFTELPSLFKNKIVKPFSSHSCYFASLLPILDKTALYQDPYKYLTETLYPVHGKMLPLPVFRSTFNVILPKIVGFGSKTIPELCADYRAYFGLSKYLGLIDPKPAELARAVLDDSRSFDYRISEFRLLLDSQISNYGAMHPEKRFIFYYNYFNTSKKFLEYVCDNDLTQVRDKVLMLKNYYSRCDYELLKEFYKLQEYVSRRPDYDYRKFYYADLRSCPEFDVKDYKDSIKTLSYYRSAQQKNDREVKFRVKHKELNDANKIFIINE